MDEKRGDLPILKSDAAADSAALKSLSGLGDVEVRITVEWGRAEITVEEAAELAEQSMLHTDKSAPDPVNVLVNGKLFARGKLVVVGDSYGVQLLEIL